MDQSSAKYFILLICGVVSFASITSAQTFFCVEASSPTTAPICNTTALQSLLPTKVCSFYAIPSLYDWTYFCTEMGYDVWRNSCPKKNLNVEDFCGGGGAQETFCNLRACTTDADCPTTLPVPMSPLQPCYDCCQICFEDTDCDTYVTSGIYAARGNTTCLSCEATPNASAVPISNTTPPVDPPVASPIAQPAICVGGFVETTGYCNCYSGFMNGNNSQQYECSVPPPSFCQPLSQVTPMENSVVPFIENLRVSSNKLGLSVYSSFIADRRTLIEFPNPECNLINSPNFYTKVNNGCNDEFIIDAPFASCGFTKSSDIYQDTYRGEVHVKYIDRVTVDGNAIDRVIDTPFAIVIRLPRNLAVQSSVEIVASPVFTVPVSAAFVGQRVDIATQTGQLEFVTSVPVPFIVIDTQLTNVPYGVNASISVVSSNCTNGYCLQHLVVDLDVIYCDISGVYSMLVSIGCTTQENCPAEVRNSPVISSLTSTIIAQRTCGEAYVDVGLQGWLQAYNDPSFTDQDLSFSSDQPAYFLINTYSAEVDIARVTLDAIYYFGPNRPGQFLLSNGTTSSLGASNNFAWGQYSNTQAWFSIDVTVSPVNSSENTLFKLNDGESGVYNFIAIVEVEWRPDSTTPASSPSSPFKKRVALQGTLPRQGTQFSAQVQIGGVRKDEAVSSSSFLTASTIALLLSAMISLF